MIHPFAPDAARVSRRKSSGAKPAFLSTIPRDPIESAALPRPGATVTTQLRSGNSSAAQNIQVQNDGNGKITLRGTVASESEKDSIESAAKAVPGVNDVDNEIEVQNQ